MTADDILGMLDLDGPDDHGGEVFEGAAPGQARPTAGPYAIRADRWAVRRGRDLIRDHEHLAAADVTEEAATDFHSAAFNHAPKMEPACTDELRHEYLTELLQTPEWRALNADTALNETASELAALHFAQGYLALRQAREQQPKPEPGPDGQPGNPTADLKAGLQVSRAVSNALKGARADVQEMADAADACGLGAGPAGGRIDPKRAAAMFKRVRGSDTLRRIMDMAGRFRRVAQSKQRAKTSHGRDDVVGITLGGELSRLIPMELVSLVLDETETDALRRLADRQMIEREHRAVEPQGKGPIVVVVDESGSMRSNGKVETAKGLALAMAWIARKQRRWVALVAFSGGTTGRCLALPPGRWDETALLGWLESFLGGGTILDVPLREMPETYWPQFVAQGMARGKTDILIVTDAICHADAPMIDGFNAWRKREQARVTTIVINGEPGDLARVSDETFRVPALSPEGEAVGRALSV